MSPDAQDRRAIVHACLVASSPLERYRPGPIRRARHGPITLIAAGDQGPAFNQALVLGPASPAELFALADAFFGDPAGYSIVVETGLVPAMDALLGARGWRLDEEEPALVLAPLPAGRPAAPPELVIRPVADAAGLADFHGVSETPSVYVPSLGAALDPAVALFVGYVAGRPVASSRLVCLGTIAELSGIVTVPTARRRGYGTALTWVALATGRERSCVAATLTATAMGYPLYQRLGFRPAGVYRTYLPA